jgi:hypothetical protein
VLFVLFSSSVVEIVSLPVSEFISHPASIFCITYVSYFTKKKRETKNNIYQRFEIHRDSKMAARGREQKASLL